MILCCPVVALCYLFFINFSICLTKKQEKQDIFADFMQKKIIFHIFVVILQPISHYYKII